ncbi:polyphosphate glucokinase [Friedmanniella endophytica]|uniref:Polyphosphate glucokinase n=1 Tax=Microlunatus kandeliicorticis TaxID=1759536 RepID=A0A7W3IU54_9ACTN|nr:ROK family protein [Microlunatus kandeliicorticis]MBA8795245.1 polyphosphate glucokinase [Microlunatus kandeliicorticis]
MTSADQQASENPNLALGIDIGGTGTKGGLVDLTTGSLVGKRFRLDTPQPATPENMIEVVVQVADHFAFDGPTGVAYPGVVLDGVTRTAANLDKSWIGTSLADRVGTRLRGPSVYLNDADAAGLAEAHYGAGRGVQGVVVVVTFGTGIGIAMINNGELVANSELGHLELDGKDAEKGAAASARERDGISWKEWGARADRYLKTLENLVWPKLFILGGGISKNPEKWVQYLSPRTPFKVAELINNAGIVGAADAAWMEHRASARQLVEHRGGNLAVTAED